MKMLSVMSLFMGTRSVTPLLAMSLCASTLSCRTAAEVNADPSAKLSPTASADAETNNSAPENMSAQKLPDFSLPTLEGETFRLSEHVGRFVIVMSFWATWCAPCLEELPHLEALYAAEKDNGLLVLAIAMDEPTTVVEVAPTARRLGLSMPVLLDSDQRAVRLYNQQRSAPMTVVIAKNAQIVKSAPGYNPGDEVHLAEQVRALLKNP